MKFWICLLCFSFSYFFPLAAQEKWDLKKCVDYAMAENLGVKNSLLTVRQNEVNLRESREQRYPNLNLSSVAGLNLGRTIDRVTNSFVTETTNFNTYSLNTGVVLYNKGVLKNQILRSSQNVKASQADADQAKQDLALNVVSIYLDILLANDNLTNASTQKLTTQAQLDQLERLIEVGNRPANDRLEIEAQLATDEQNIIGFQNAVDLNTLRLKQVMQLDPARQIEIVRPDVEIPPIESLDLDLNSIYHDALQNQQSIKAFDHRLESAKLDEEIAKSQLYPSLNLGGQLSTNYSSQADEVLSTTRFSTDSDVLINGESAVVTSFFDSPTSFFTTPYFNQIGDNLGGGINLSLNIPLYNNYSNKANIERAKLNFINVNNNLEIEKQNIRNQIEQSVTDVKSAQKQLEASDRTVKAREAAYKNTERRFELGSANSFELTTAKNQWDNSKIDYLRNKYNYIFRIKILDYYRGRPLNLNQ